VATARCREEFPGETVLAPAGAARDRVGDGGPAYRQAHRVHCFHVGREAGTT